MDIKILEDLHSELVEKRNQYTCKDKYFSDILKADAVLLDLIYKLRRINRLFEDESNKLL